MGWNHELGKDLGAIEKNHLWYLWPSGSMKQIGHLKSPRPEKKGSDDPGVTTFDNMVTGNITMTKYKSRKNN